MSTAGSPQGYEMVAVPQPRTGSGAHKFALAVRSTQEGASYVVGADGPAHMPVDKLYFTSGEKEFEVDLTHRTLTVADKASFRVTIFPIDVEAMNGRAIQHGNAFQIVLADEDRTERPLKVDRWVAATEPQFEREDLPNYVSGVDKISMSISATVKEAERAGNVKVQTFESTPVVETPQPTTTSAPEKVVDIREAAPKPEISREEAALLDIDSPVHPKDALNEADKSLAVIVDDPNTGMRFWAREWQEDLSEEHELTLLRLRNLGYRVVILEMDGGRSASIALTDKNELPVLTITSRSDRPPVERFLTEETWNQRFSPNKPFNFTVESMLDGSPAPEQGSLSTPSVSRITATADRITGSVDARYKISRTLARHRNALSSKSLEKGRSLARSSR